MTRPHKIRILIIIIVILHRVQEDLTNDTTSGLNFDMWQTMRTAIPYLFDVDEDEWDTPTKDVYDAADALGAVIDPENLGTSGQITDAYSALCDAVSNLP